MLHTKHIERSRLLETISAPGHVLLCAPLGYGKSQLLSQFAAQQGGELITCVAGDTTTTLIERGARHGLLLLDDAHLLSDDVIGELLRQNSSELRVMLAVRHLLYPGLILLAQRRRIMLIDSSDLAFTAQELTEADFSTAKEDLWVTTRGWPLLVALHKQPLLNSNALLQNLVDELPAESLRVAQAIARLDSNTDIVNRFAPDELISLLNSGFPLIQEDDKLRIHPLIRPLLFGEKDFQSSDFVPQDIVLEQLLRDTDSPVSVQISRVMTFLNQGGDDDFHTAAKARLLSRLPIEQMPPTMVDTYAYYLMATMEMDESQKVLWWQHMHGTPSARTYGFLARLANNHSDFLRLIEMLQLGEARAKDDDDLVRIYCVWVDYYMRQGDIEKCLEYAQRAYKAAQHAKSIELQLMGYSKLAHAMQVAANLHGAKVLADAGLKLSLQLGKKYERMTMYLHMRLSEITKDLGDFEKALWHVQQGMQILADSPNATKPYLYTCRGYIYSELGDYEAAVEAFETSAELYASEENTVGMIPNAHVTYSLYRLGWLERIYEHMLTVKQLGERANAGDDMEHLIYYPFAEGMWHTGRRNHQAAINAFRRVNLQGTMTYDAVLLAHLMLGEILVETGAYTSADAETLVAILDARNTTGDPTAYSYGREFQGVFQAIVAMGIQPERFQSLMRGERHHTESRPFTRPTNAIQLRTLGVVGVTINGIPVVPRSKYGLYLLAYLLDNPGWHTADDIGEQLFSETKDPRNMAHQAVARLRTLLGDVDRELLSLLDDSSKSRGYRLNVDSPIQVTADFQTILKNFSADNSNYTYLFDTLNTMRPFQPTVYSVFASQMNNRLADRVVEVALKLTEIYLAADQHELAARVLLMGRCFTDDPALIKRHQELLALEQRSAGLAS